MAFVMLAPMFKDFISDIEGKLAFTRRCLGEPTRGRKHNQTGKRARPSKKGKRR